MHKCSLFWELKNVFIVVVYVPSTDFKTTVVSDRDTIL